MDTGRGGGTRRGAVRVDSTTMAATDSARRLAEIAALAAADKLAQDVVAIDVSERLPLTDCFVIASAPNERQVQAVVDNVEEKLRDSDVKAVRREGTQEARWVLLDYGDVVVHVLHTDEREFYGLERLWKDCPRLELPAEVTGPVGAGD
jgi:ribosome-associated protein